MIEKERRKYEMTASQATTVADLLGCREQKQVLSNEQSIRLGNRKDSLTL